MDQGALAEAQLRRLIDAGRRLVAEHDLERLLVELLEAARDITGARYAALGILDAERHSLARFITVGIDEERRAAIGDLPRGRGILGLLTKDPRPLRLADVASHPESYGFPPGHPPMTTFLGVPIRIRGAAWGNLYLTEKEGGAEFSRSDEQSLVVLADWASVAIQNADLLERLEARRDDLERAVVRLESTAEIARAVGGETDLARVLELIAKRGRALASARAVLIMLAEGDELVVSAAAGEVEEDIRGRRLPLESSSAGEVLRSGRPLRLAGGELKVARQELGVEWRTALLVPLAFRGESLGLLAAFDRSAPPPAFTADDERLMGSFAASAATAVYTARSVTQDRLRHAWEAAEQERRRWARELHDETLQGLGALQVLLSSARGRRQGEALEDAVEAAVSQTGEEIRKLRALITELRPAALDELGLGPAIESLAERTGQAHGLEVGTRLDLGDERLPRELENGVYRLTQEALTNVAKHASAARAEVSVTCSDGAVTLSVEDDGVGFDPGAPRAGLGLQGMKERVALLGGELEVSSAQGKGTRVEAVLPAAAAGTPPPTRAPATLRASDREALPAGQRGPR